MFWGGLWSSCWGGERDIWLSQRVDDIAGEVRLRARPVEAYRNRYVGIFTGAVLRRVVKIPQTGDLNLVLPYDPGISEASVWISDFGDWETYPYEVPNGNALAFDLETARRIYMRWQAPYALTSIEGTTDLSSLTITGAVRQRNTQDVSGWPTRGRLLITTTNSGTTRIVRLWANGVLQAEGYRTGDGSVTLSERNGSGLTGTVSITYTADVLYGEAYVDIRWPKTYQIHYSTSTLTYPRTPEYTVSDNRSDLYGFLTPVLSEGVYNFNVVPVDDDGTEQSAPAAPADSPLSVWEAPESPTIVSVTGTAAAGLSVTITAGATGLQHTLYYSDVNEPINYGACALPAPLVNVVDDLTFTTAAITGYAPNDLTADWATLISDIDAAVATANTAFDAGQDGFATAFQTLIDAVDAAIETFESASGDHYDEFQTALTNTGEMFLAQIEAFSEPETNGAALTYNYLEACTQFVGSDDLRPIGAFPDTATAFDALADTGMVISHVVTPDSYASFYATIAVNDIVKITGATADDFGIYRIGEVDDMPGDSQIRLKSLTLIGSSGTFPADSSAITIQFYEAKAGWALLDETAWVEAAGVHYGSYLGYLSKIIGGAGARYTFGSGALPGGAAGGTGAGVSPDGTTGLATNAGTTLYDLAAPLIRRGIVRMVARATDTGSGVQETADVETWVEFAADGSIVGSRPNTPEITESSMAGLVLTSTIQVQEDDSAADATRVYLHWKTASSAEITDTSTGTSAYAELPTAFRNQHEADVAVTFPSAGFYQIRARSYAAGVYSEFGPTVVLWADNTAPAAVLNLTGDVVRGQPATEA